MNDNTTRHALAVRIIDLRSKAEYLDALIRGKGLRGNEQDLARARLTILDEQARALQA